MYLIPANSKKGQLIFNIFRPIDLIIFTIGAALSLIMLLLIKSNTLAALAIKLAPIVVTAVFIMPVPHYHNVMMFLKDMIDFFSNRRVYVWKGWCVTSEYTED